MGDSMLLKSRMPTEEKIYISFGNEIKSQRHKACMTQEYLAELIGVDQRYMSMIENGKSKINIGICIKISYALNVPIQVLFKEIITCDNSNDTEEAVHYLNTLSDEKMEFALSFLKNLSNL